MLEQTASDVSGSSSQPDAAMHCHNTCLESKYTLAWMHKPPIFVAKTTLTLSCPLTHVSRLKGKPYCMPTGDMSSTTSSLDQAAGAGILSPKSLVIKRMEFMQPAVLQLLAYLEVQTSTPSTIIHQAPCRCRKSHISASSCMKLINGEFSNFPFEVMNIAAACEKVVPSSLQLTTHSFAGQGKDIMERMVKDAGDICHV